MKKYYFTFGQSHVHSVAGFTYDKDIVVEIEAMGSNQAREIMMRTFGRIWGMQYDEPPPMEFFPRGIKKIQ